MTNEGGRRKGEGGTSRGDEGPRWISYTFKGNFERSHKLPACGQSDATPYIAAASALTHLANKLEARCYEQMSSVHARQRLLVSQCRGTCRDVQEAMA